MDRRVAVIIEVPRGSFIKRRPDGSVDFVSPLPSPFNYGSVIGELADDGDPLDALVLGPRLAFGTTVEVAVFGEVDFIDAGDRDPKLVCSRGVAPRELDWLRVPAFFAIYARLKRGLNRVRGRPGPTRVRAIDRSSPRL